MKTKRIKYWIPLIGIYFIIKALIGYNYEERLLETNPAIIGFYHGFTLMIIISTFVKLCL